MSAEPETLFDDISPAFLPPHGAKVLVLSGTYEQARDWANRIRLTSREWQFVSPQATRGYMNPLVYLVGTWLERPDLDEIALSLAPSRPVLMRGSELVSE